MEKLEKSGGGGAAASAGGSYLNHVPPFPMVKAWVQEKRSTWQEKGPVPQLFVMWSIQQNDLVPIDKWLRDVAEKGAQYGLEILSVASPNDVDAIGAYLKVHKFPGAVAIDRREKPGIGDTFTAYSVQRFNLPRVILLDIDGKVVWEGDPGFKAGETYEAGSESFLDTPLAELVEKRKLKELTAWLSAWRETGAPALAKGDLAGSYELLKQSKEFTTGILPVVDDAQKKLASLENAFANLRETAASFVEDEAQPAFKHLLDYAPVMKKSIDKNTRFALQSTLDCKSTKDWATALTICERLKNHVKPADKTKIAQELMTKLPNLTGRFPRELASDLAPLVEQNDLAALQRLATDAPERPQQWVIHEYLRW
jgi:hypothetical protein